MRVAIGLCPVKGAICEAVEAARHRLTSFVSFPVHPGTINSWH